MFDEPVVFVDIETTGGSYRTSRIIEIAVIRVENDEITESFSTLINPGAPIPHHITRLTGISETDVNDAPFFADIAERLHSILLGAVFIAHHVRFDYSFIKRQLEMCNIRYCPRMLCSVRMSRALYPGHRGHGLEAIINRFNIPVASRHRAFDDAEAVLKFLRIAREEHGPEVFSAAAARQLKHLSAPPNLPGGALDNIPNTPGVYTFSDESGVPIYIGKSVTLRKRILSHFTQDTAIDKEMKLSLHTHKISYIETANELEALLLESRMVKELLPLYNRQLRRLKKMYVLHSADNPEGYRTARIDFVDAENIGPDPSIYGVYSSKMKAKSALETIQKTYDLCPKLLGLEKTSGACFKSQLGKCRGGCTGRELPFNYNFRFETAFENSRLEAWPYKQPVVITHPDQPEPQKGLVVDNWNVIGELRGEEGCDVQYKPWQSVFDIDSYKILRSYLSQKSGHLKLLPISYGELEEYR